MLLCLKGYYKSHNMVKENLLKRIEEIKSGHLKQKPEKEVRHLSYQEFPKHTRQKCAHKSKTLKRLLTIAAVSFISFSNINEAEPKTPPAYTREPAEVIEYCQNVINNLVEQRTSALQNEIISNLSVLQQEITAAKINHSRDKVVKGIFDSVYEKGGLTGNMNYCVAGAMFAQMECKDTILNNILPDPSKTAKDYNFDGHPSVSCRYMREYFQQRFGKNYAEHTYKNFNEFAQTLEAGDLITIRSTMNTSTGEHCVTCAGPVVNGKIQVKSLNGERDYEISVNQIIGAVKVMEQYREMLAQTLEKELSVKDILLTSERLPFVEGLKKYHNVHAEQANVQSKINPIASVRNIEL